MSNYTVERVVVLSDMHVPYHDQACESLVLRFLQEFAPTTLIIDGDVIDFYALSTFDREPSRRFDLAKDIQTTQNYMAELKKAVPATCKTVLIGGNHEDRLRKYLWSRAPELTGVVGTDIPDLLKLTKNNWQYVSYYNAPESNAGVPGYNLSNVLLVTHGICISKYSAYTARAHFDRFHTSGISAHSHRLGTYYFRAYGGSWIWLENGALCTLEPPYSPSPNWEQGFSAGYIFHDSDKPSELPRFEMQNVLIHNRKLVWQGKLYKAS